MSPILGIWASAQQPALNATSFDSIATVTVGAGGSSSISFSSIPSTYKHLQIRHLDLTGTATNDLRMRFNSDSGTNYVWHQLQGNGTAASAAANTSQTYIAGGVVGGSSIPAVSVIDILDYTNTNKNKTARILFGYDANGSGYVGLWSGLWLNTNAVTDITFTTNSGNFNQNSTFALYGIKGA